ncbi:hypothetical protein [Citrobacter cronae]|uniref:Uncharacterized protein n=1 Tax=Citrobacter cronae TaxID=1748967 RepID=A0A7X1BSA7_9ENTR|nr:hypothetical protein [Citrobacter cronae]EBD5844621.1 hypothetical protein [Salmonella enterica]EDD5453073.1 hypothetical protein [Salmonella enterica subsp. enterica serovar Paratyphi B]EBD6594462.1 hypothetical protein [Salmonella enterica]EDE4812363.1 hypothetical protein [Salmonella enterica subsp. enterica serovar Paratyphi B]MBC2622209.1 hypothetical protein [Citrobacter cronae]
MIVLKNKQINDDINKKELSGWNASQLKSLYVERNIFNTAPDTPIFKIMRMRHFIGDLKGNCLTHMFPNKNVWLDDYENLLMRVQFTEQQSQQPLYLSGVMENLYATCWTLNDENQDDWLVFSGGEPAVRLETTPRKLLEALMNINDKYFMLHHFIGKVMYEAESDVLRYFLDPDYDKHLDPLGQGSALALMLLRNNVSHENEVRLIYEYKEDQVNNPWVKSNVTCFPQKCCHVPVDWSAVLKSISVSKSSTTTDLQQVKSALASANIHLSVSQSCIPDR